MKMSISNYFWTGEMGQWLREIAVHHEDWSLDPSTYTKQLKVSVPQLQEI